MELKNVNEEQENTLLHDNLLPTPVEIEVEQQLEDNDKVFNKRDELINAPTSPFKTIQPILKCPPAPHKPKACPLRKRKGLRCTPMRLLDYSKDVLAMYPPALIADFGNKVKKAKRSSGYHEQHFKENICTNLNS